MRYAWLLLMLGASSAHATDRISLAAVQADWVRYGQQSEFRWFPFGGPHKIDLKTLSRSGTTVVGWVRSPALSDALLEQYPTASYFVMKMHFDCRAKTSGQSGMVAYDGQSKVLFSTNTPDYLVEYTPSSPESVGEFQLDLACS